VVSLTQGEGHEGSYHSTARWSFFFFFFITKGFLNAFNDIGVEAKYWDGDQKSWFDFDPDLYCGASGHRQNIPLNRGKCKVAVHVNPFGVQLKPLFGVDINEPRHAIDWTAKQKPDAVFGYGLQQDAKTYWKNWSDIAPFVGCPTAGDVTEYYPQKEDCDYKVAFLGGRWGYKGHNINKWLLPSIYKLGNKIAIKGWGGWQEVKQYHGVLPESDSGRVFLSSALVGPCVCEPHTSDYGIDIPERFFKVALCGALPIMDNVVGFDRYCDNYVMASNPNDYYTKILNYSSNPDYIEEGKRLAAKIREEVLKKHTYHHRMRDLCLAVGFDDIAKRFDERIAKFD